MQTRGFWRLDGVSDLELQAGLSRLLGWSSRTEARILAHLAEVDRRKLALVAGYRSLFEYCLKHLKLSENEAGRRIAAARLARRFPVIFEMIESRRLHLTGACLLAPYLTDDNHVELLAEAAHKTKDQIEMLLARRFPRPGAKAFIRRQSGRMTPLSDTRYRIQLDVDARLKLKVERARDLVSHANPNGELAAIFERGLDLLIEQLERRRFGKRKRALTKPAAPADSAAAGLAAVARRAKMETDAINAAASPTDMTSAALAAAASRPEIGADGIGAAANRPEIGADGIGAAANRPEIGAAANRPEIGADGIGAGANRQGTRTEAIDAEAVQADALARYSSRPRIPSAVRREVAARDGMRCTYVSETGHRCSATAFLQLHHERPFACGGGEERENLRLLCAGHNRLLAEQDFGAAHMKRCVAKAQASARRGARQQAAPLENAPRLNEAREAPSDASNRRAQRHSANRTVAFAGADAFAEADAFAGADAFAESRCLRWSRCLR